MRKPLQLTRWQRIQRYAACYVLWVLTIVLGYVVVAIIWRAALQRAIVAYIDETDLDARYSGGAMYLFGITFMLFGLFIMVMTGEPYLRDGAERGRLMHRWARLVVPLLVLGALGVLVQAVATMLG